MPAAEPQNLATEIRDEVAAFIKKGVADGKDAIEIGNMLRGEMDHTKLQLLMDGMRSGGAFEDGIGLQARTDRNLALQSPAYLITEMLDPFYKEHFEHPEMLDEVVAPYILGEMVRIEGVNYDPKDYVGLLVTKSRNTFKSSVIVRLTAVLWEALYLKCIKGEDSRAMLVHQKIDKAIEHIVALKEIAKRNDRFRAAFPEFAHAKGEWDTSQHFRWPCFDSYMANEWSVIGYGEISDKTGGHHTIRAVDDWETEKSVTSPDQIEDSIKRFQMMNNLKDRARPYNPIVVCGTNYHYRALHKKLEDHLGWLVYRKPAHRGSATAVFDLLRHDPRTESGKKKINAGIRKLERERSDDLNYPKMYPWRELYQSAFATSPYDYNTQLQLDPMPEGEQRFNHAAIEAMWVENIPLPSEMWIYVRADPAISEKKNRDDMAILVGGVQWNGHRWFLDGWVGREKRPSVQVRRLFTLAKKWMAKGYRVKGIGIEAVGYQEALAGHCRDGVPERDAEYSGESVPIILSPCTVQSIPRSTQVHKNERLISMEGPIERREAHIWKGNPVGEKLAREYRDWPFGTDNLLDTAHDFWIRTSTPPKEIEPEIPAIPPIIAELMQRNQAGELTGLNNTVKLAGWG